MKYLTYILWCLICAIPLFVSCKKQVSNNGTLQTTINHIVDGQNLLYDSLLYTNDAGNKYSITKLNYYLSGFIFRKKGGEYYCPKGVYYLDAFNSNLSNCTFYEIPVGQYDQITFFVGLDSTHNITDALPATIDNVNMAWPNMMGGGYHFMKLEGHAVDGVGSYGFAMHLGKGKNLITITLNRDIMIESGRSTAITLTMNINEWFRNPVIYNFETDGNYTMSNDTSMYKLKNNGSDVFGN